MVNSASNGDCNHMVVIPSIHKILGEQTIPPVSSKLECIICSTYIIYLHQHYIIYFINLYISLMSWYMPLYMYSSCAHTPIIFLVYSNETTRQITHLLILSEAIQAPIVLSRTFHRLIYHFLELYMYILFCSSHCSSFGIVS